MEYHMTRDEYCLKIEEAISHMDFNGTYTYFERYGNGHINDTFVVYMEQEDKTQTRYILQRINHEIFHNPEQLMKNIVGVTDFIKDKILLDQGDVKRETLNLVFTKEGNTFYRDSIGSFWRAFLFIEDAVSYDIVERPEDFYRIVCPASIRCGPVPQVPQPRTVWEHANQPQNRKS
jgi:hypothetical protein